MNRDFKDLLSGFNAGGVEFIVVGSHAMAAHGYVRATKDLDVWVNPTAANAARVMAALAGFGAPISDLRPEDFSEPGSVCQIGVAPVRIDIITTIDGVLFEEAWKDRRESRFAGEVIPVLSLRDLIRNKRASGRTQDLADLEALGRLQRAEGDPGRHGDRS